MNKPSDTFAAVCWSNSQERRNKHDGALGHLQGSETHTLCGILTTEMWSFDLDEDHTPAVWIEHQCQRCRKALEHIS